jgi:glycerol uptake facilitator-like aquaporin
MNGSLLRRVLAELLGTALLAFFGPGAVVAALTMGKGSLDYAAWESSPCPLGLSWLWSSTRWVRSPARISTLP